MTGGVGVGEASGALPRRPNLSQQAGSPLLSSPMGVKAPPKPERIMGNRAIAFDALQPKPTPSYPKPHRSAPLPQPSVDAAFSSLWKAAIPCWWGAADWDGTRQGFRFRGDTSFIKIPLLR